jgi:basic membrane protein A
MSACEELAAEYPGVVFAHASGNRYNSTNFTNYFGRMYQARYLSGIVAGLNTRSNQLGFVAAMGKNNSEVTGGLNAFALGAESVNPAVKVYVKVTNSWFDPAGEIWAAQSLIKAGCDVIAQHCDTPSPQLAAAAAGVRGIGYNSDMRRDAPGTVLTSVVWHWGVYYTKLVRSVIDGTFTTRPYFGGMNDGVVNLSPLNDALVVPESQEALNKARERIKGGWDVFTGVMPTNDGKQVGSPDRELSDNEIQNGMNWYYHNIIEM